MCKEVFDDLAKVFNSLNRAFNDICEVINKMFDDMIVSIRDIVVKENGVLDNKIHKNFNKRNSNIYLSNYKYIPVFKRNMPYQRRNY